MKILSEKLPFMVRESFDMGQERKVHDRLAVRRTITKGLLPGSARPSCFSTLLCSHSREKFESQTLRGWSAVKKVKFDEYLL